jgi:hypothetical protein
MDRKREQASCKRRDRAQDEQDRNAIENPIRLLPQSVLVAGTSRAPKLGAMVPIEVGKA